MEDALLQASFLALRRTSNFPVFLSAHQSKGREFDYVIIPWLANVPEDKTTYYEGINQFGKITGDVMRDDEERRLLYVAFSRAKERVTILYPEESPSPLLRQWGLV
ncbi:MAG: 3'-5' exonuclease [Thermodesulfobacteriota bacterium]|nr:3'-5' exonuclease [Thermodesulfobacteriota bacterium]